MLCCCNKHVSFKRFLEQYETSFLTGIFFIGCCLVITFKNAFRFDNNEQLVTCKRAKIDKMDVIRDELGQVQTKNILNVLWQAIL